MQIRMHSDESDPLYRGSLCVSVAHDGHEPLVWDASVYPRAITSGGGGSEVDNDNPDEEYETVVTGNKLRDIFVEFNEYLSTVPAARQEQLYKAYAKAREFQSAGYSASAMTEALQRVAKEIYDILPPAEVVEWVRNHPRLVIPETVKDAFGEDDQIDRTYLTEDYIRLVALGVSTRAMFPIWGEFKKSSKTEAGTNRKELEALRLLYYTSLSVTPAMERLERYIDAAVKAAYKNGPSIAAIMGGAGTYATPEIIFAIVITRRLATCALIGTDTPVNVITNINQFIVNNLRGIDRRYGGTKYGSGITSKDTIASQKEDGNDSRMESCRVKESVPAAVGVKKITYSYNIDSIREYIDPEVPVEYIAQCAKSIESRSVVLFNRTQVFLMQALAGSSITKEHPAMAARGLPLMDQPAHNRLASVVQATLWHWEMPLLATYLTAEEVPMQEEILGATDNRRYTSLIMKTLSDLFPYERTGGRGKQRQKHANVGQRVIEQFCVEARRPLWRLHAPEALLQKLPPGQSMESYEYHANIRDEVIALFTRINSQ